MIVREPLKDGYVRYYSRGNKLLLDENTGKKYTIYLQRPGEPDMNFVEIVAEETNENITPILIETPEDLERYEL